MVGGDISVEGRIGMSNTDLWLLTAQQEGVGCLKQLENKTDFSISSKLLGVQMFDFEWDMSSVVLKILHFSLCNETNIRIWGVHMG